MAELTGERVVLRPIEQDDEETLRAIRDTPEVATWWGPPEDDFPFGDEPEAIRLTILADGEVAGMVQFSEEREPDYPYAEIDIFLAPGHHGRGLGTDAVRTTSRHLLDDRGHHRLVIGVNVDNVVALRCYEKAGFRRVGLLQAAARDYRTGDWGDEYLMERVELPNRR